MLEAKTFELRDRATFIPILAVSMKINDGARIERSVGDEYLLRRAGYGPNDDCVVVTRLDAQGGKASQACCESHQWNDRTFQVAHEYIESHWRVLESGQVIDVEFLLGETPLPKTSEREIVI